MQNRPSPGRPVLRCEKHHKRRIGWNGVSKKEGHAPRVTPGRGSGRVPALCHGPVFAGRATLKKGQRLAESGAFRQSDVVGRLVHCQTLAAQNRPRGRAAVLPIAHPLSVAPAVRAEEGDFFAGEQRFKLGKERLEHTSAPIAGQPSASLSYCAASAARTLSAEKSAASSPAPFNPSRTACAIASVLPVPDQ